MLGVETGAYPAMTSSRWRNPTPQAGYCFFQSRTTCWIAGVIRLARYRFWGRGAPSFGVATRFSRVALAAL